MKRAPDQKTAEGASVRAAAIVPQFAGTDNPRHQRVLALLMLRPAKREEVDAVAGASNGPELVAELRRRGLTAPCERIEAIDRDGRPCRPGIYSLSTSDRRKIHRWLASGRR